jgi:predicted nuclease with TOPRIM domain
MGKMNLSLIATIVPLIIVGIGLIGWVLSLRSDVTTTVEQLEAVQEQAESLAERMAQAEKNLAIADDQMNTIMGEHEVIGEMFQKMGEIQPAGERRTYGGYGN